MQVLKRFDFDSICFDNDVGVSSRYFLWVFGWICSKTCSDLLTQDLLLVSILQVNFLGLILSV